MGSPTSNPRVNIQLLAAAQVDAFADRRNLIVGQKGVGGTATTKVLVQNVHLLTDTAIATQFGTGEMYFRILEWKAGAQVSDGGIIPVLDVIPVDEVSGTAASCTLTFTGTATADGSFTVSVVDEDRFDVIVPVASGDTPTVIAAAVDAAFDLIAIKPFTTAPVAGVLTFTAADSGTSGNFFGNKITGVATTVVPVFTAWASGATDPVVTDIFDVIDGRRYTGVSWPEYWKADLDVPKDEFDARFNVSNGILDGVVFHGRSETFANAQTAVSTLNSQSLVLVGNNTVTGDTQNGPAILTPPDWQAAFFMAIRAKRLTTGAQIADLIIAQNAPRDATGGPSLASLPYFNTALNDAPVTVSADLYSSTEQITLENDGFTHYGVNIAGNTMIMGPVVTTFTTDAGGNPNDSFHYLNFVDTGSVCREIIFNTLRAVYAQSRLTEGDLIQGRSIENPASIKQQLMSIYRFLADLVLVQAGTEAETFFSDNTTVEITGGSLSNRGVTINGVLPIVTQLGTIDYNLSLAFTIGQTGTTITV